MDSPSGTAKREPTLEPPKPCVSTVHLCAHRQQISPVMAKLVRVAYGWDDPRGGRERQADRLASHPGCHRDRSPPGCPAGKGPAPAGGCLERLWVSPLRYGTPTCRSRRMQVGKAAGVGNDGRCRWSEFHDQRHTGQLGLAGEIEPLRRLLHPLGQSLHQSGQLGRELFQWCITLPVATREDQWA
jgi:hypothetical protein